jgi:hypothetical protein
VDQGREEEVKIQVEDEERLGMTMFVDVAMSWKYRVWGSRIREYTHTCPATNQFTSERSCVQRYLILLLLCRRLALRGALWEYGTSSQMKQVCSQSSPFDRFTS